MQPPNSPHPGYSQIPAGSPTGVIPPPHQRPNQELEFIVPVNVAPLALIAGYVGLASLFLCLPSPIALLLGILALRSLSRNPNQVGKGRAWFAIVAGAVGMLAMLFWLVAFVVKAH